MPSVRTGQPSSVLLTLADQVLQPGFHGTVAPDWIRHAARRRAALAPPLRPQHPRSRADRRAHRCPARREP